MAFTFGLSHVATGRAKTPIGHTCSVTDRQFIDTAKTNLAAIGLWGQEYLSGDAKPKEVVSEATDAAKIVDGTSPTDPSLSQTRALMVSMFTEYAKAMQAQARGRGYAQRGMRDLCRLLLDAVPAVCLFVRRENAPAIRVYEAVGMRRTISYRSLIF